MSRLAALNVFRKNSYASSFRGIMAIAKFRDDLQGTDGKQMFDRLYLKNEQGKVFFEGAWINNAFSCIKFIDCANM